MSWLQDIELLSRDFFTTSGEYVWHVWSSVHRSRHIHAWLVLAKNNGIMKPMSQDLHSVIFEILSTTASIRSVLIDLPLFLWRGGCISEGVHGFPFCRWPCTADPNETSVWETMTAPPQSTEWKLECTESIRKLNAVLREWANTPIQQKVKIYNKYINWRVKS